MGCGCSHKRCGRRCSVEPVGWAGNESGEPAAAAPMPDAVIDVSVKNLRFTPEAIQIALGKTVKLTMRNMDGTEHDLQVEGLRVTHMGEQEMDEHHAGVAPNMLTMHAGPNGTDSAVFRANQPEASSLLHLAWPPGGGDDWQIDRELNWGIELPGTDRLLRSPRLLKPVTCVERAALVSQG